MWGIEEKGENMGNATLLRYPGGKTRAVKILKEYPLTNTIVSPFFGGGSFEFNQLNAGKTVIANDTFYCLANFWNVVNTQPILLANTIEPYLHRVNKQDFNNMQEVLKTAESKRSVEDEILLAAQFYIVNRCSFSGSTLSGGFSANASTTRFTLSGVNKIKNWVVTSRLTVENKDFTEFLTPLVSFTGYSWFLDPPYYLKSSNLYGVNGGYHGGFDHYGLRSLVKEFDDRGGGFLLTYNDSPFIREFYQDYSILPAAWSYGMNKSKKSSEIVITNVV